MVTKIDNMWRKSCTYYIFDPPKNGTLEGEQRWGSCGNQLPRFLTGSTALDSKEHSFLLKIHWFSVCLLILSQTPLVLCWLLSLLHLQDPLQVLVLEFWISCLDHLCFWPLHVYLQSWVELNTARAEHIKPDIARVTTCTREHGAGYERRTSQLSSSTGPRY